MAFRAALQVHLTDDCTLRCRHCYASRGGTYLSGEQFDHILVQALRYWESLAIVPGRALFTGGEPTLSPILSGCIAKCVRAGFRDIYLLTNGAALTEEFAGRLLEADAPPPRSASKGTEPRTIGSATNRGTRCSAPGRRAGEPAFRSRA